MSTAGQDVQRAAPPYEIMRYHWLSGLSYREMAELYGVTQRTGVHETFKRRTIRRGEQWPIERHVPTYGIWRTVKQRMRERARADQVWVTTASAIKYAPTCSVSYRVTKGTGKLTVALLREHWSTERFAPRYHVDGCMFLQRDRHGQLVGDVVPMADDPHLFRIDTAEAEDWGYRPCHYCTQGLMVKLAADSGLPYELLLSIECGKRKRLYFHEARALLEAVGEPIHPRLLPKPPRVCEICGRPGPLVDEHWRSHGWANQADTAGGQAPRV
jgi:hypothetical protein